MRIGFTASTASPFPWNRCERGLYHLCAITACGPSPAAGLQTRTLSGRYRSTVLVDEALSSVRARRILWTPPG